MTDMAHETAPTVSVRFRLDAREWGRAGMAALRAGRLGRWLRPTLWVLTLGGPLAAGAAIRLGAGTVAEVVGALVPWEILTVFWLGFFEFLPPLVAPLMLRRMRSRGEEREEERVVSQAGLDVTGGLDATYLSWAAMGWVRETKEFFLFRGYRDTYFIPKRLLSETQLARVRQLAAQNCHTQVHLLPTSERAT